MVVTLVLSLFFLCEVPAWSDRQWPAAGEWSASGRADLDLQPAVDRGGTCRSAAL